MIVSALVFAWENAVRIRANESVDEHGIKHYKIVGPLFFGSTTAFAQKFNLQDDPEEVIIDFKESRIMDQSAIEAINKVAERYQKEGKNIHLRHLSRDCRITSYNVCYTKLLRDPRFILSLRLWSSIKSARF